MLSTRHPVGRFKAAFFAGLGYTEGDWARLADDLRAQHLVLDAEEGEQSEYGRTFTITGVLAGPNGRTAVIVSVWVILEGDEAPRFVTAYPGGKS